MKKKFIDGTPVDEDYETEITNLIEGACIAEELVDIEELEFEARLMGLSGEGA